MLYEEDVKKMSRSDRYMHRCMMNSIIIDAKIKELNNPNSEKKKPMKKIISGAWKNIFSSSCETTTLVFLLLLNSLLVILVLGGDRRTKRLFRGFRIAEQLWMIILRTRCFPRIENSGGWTNFFLESLFLVPIFFGITFYYPFLIFPIASAFIGGTDTGQVVLNSFYYFAMYSLHPFKCFYKNFVALLFGFFDKSSRKGGEYSSAYYRCWGHNHTSFYLRRNTAQLSKKTEKGMWFRWIFIMIMSVLFCEMLKIRSFITK
jgi:hypothetical protein